MANFRARILATAAYMVKEHGPHTNYNGPRQKGIYIGSARAGNVKYFVPDAETGEGMALGPDGVLYGATPTGITRFLPKKTPQ